MQPRLPRVRRLNTRLLLVSFTQFIQTISRTPFLTNTPYSFFTDEIQKTHPKLKLYYFNIPGKGEPIRLACAYGGVELDDFRMHANEFHDLKVSGKLAFGQVPALSVNDDQMIFQSAAIMRYVGKLTGLYPTNDDLLAAKIDMIVDSENDMFTGLAVSRYRGTFAFFNSCVVRYLLSCFRNRITSKYFNVCFSVLIFLCCILLSRSLRFRLSDRGACRHGAQVPQRRDLARAPAQRGEAVGGIDQWLGGRNR